MYRVLSIPMKQLSRSVVFVYTNPKSERIAELKDSATLSRLDDDDTEVYQKSLVGMYMHRPQDLQSMSLVEFAATFVPNYKPTFVPNYKVDESDTMSSQITLTDGFGKMSYHKREAVIRFHRCNKYADPTN